MAQENLDRALAADPEFDDMPACWTDEILQRYEDYRTNVLIEEYLDNIERFIHRHNLDDHVGLLGLIAVEMEVGHNKVTAYETIFDHRWHQLENAPPGPQKEIYQKVITEVLHSGYTDLKTSNVIRKTMVRTKILSGKDIL
jgi:molecular chaperone GrpE (heat shock protein)